MKEKVKVEKILLQQIAIRVADQLRNDEFISESDMEVNRDYIITSIYHELIGYFKVIE